MVKRVVFGARYGLAGWLAQRVTAVEPANRAGHIVPAAQDNLIVRSLARDAPKT